MNRHPPSNYGDAPPAYLNHDTSYLSDPDSPTNASRLNTGTMRLLPSGDGADDSGISHSPSHYDPDYDHTPYVLPNPVSSQPPHHVNEGVGFGSARGSVAKETTGM